MRPFLRSLSHPGFLRAATAALLVAATLPGAASLASADTGDSASPGEFTERLIIHYRPGTAGALVHTLAFVPRTHAAVHARGLQMVALRRTAAGAQLMRLDREVSLDEARALARAIEASDPSVAEVEVDQRLQAQAAPGDPMFERQWHLRDPEAGIDAPAAWERSTGEGAVVAVVDSGVRPHADLLRNLLPGYDFIGSLATANDGGGRDGDATDPGDAVTNGECGAGHAAAPSSWHGTHVTGLVAAAADNGLGGVGVAFDAKVVPVRVLGRCGGYVSDIADGIVWAAGGSVPGAPANAHPAAVINVSVGGYGPCPTSMQHAIDMARARGRLVVVAAGNASQATANEQPANCRGAFVVAATDREGARAVYSNSGPEVALAAPGGTGGGNYDPFAILSTFNAGRAAPGADSYQSLSGTSMAAPQVAGVAALMLSLDTTLDGNDLAALLKGTARRFPARCLQCGAGLLDAGSAVASVPWRGTVPRVVAGAWTRTGHVDGQLLNRLPVKARVARSSRIYPDAYRIAVPPGATLHLRLLPDPEDAGSLRVLDATGRTRSFTAAGAGLPVAASVPNSGRAAAWLTVQVRRLPHADGATGAYSLEAAL